MTKHKKLGYLVSRYPSISHTFILREILALRDIGFSIKTASINETDIKNENLLPIEWEEVKQTFYVKKQGTLKAIVEFIKAFFVNPKGFIRGLFFSFKLAHGSIYQIFYHLFYFIEALLVLKWMKSNNISHLHVHFANPSATVALILSRICSATYSMTVHGPDEFYDVSFNHLKEKIENAKFVFCISNYAKSQMMRIVLPEYWNKLDVVHLGVNPEIYTPNPFRENPKVFNLLYVGRMTTTKGGYILIQTLHDLIQKGVPLTLTLVGDGPDRESLEKLVASDRITFSGALNCEDTLLAYKKADIFILPSFAEGIPVVLMEAMSMEIPCIATAVNGIPELIKNEINGILVSPANPLELANAILKLIQNKELRFKIGKAGRQTVLEKFDLKKNTAFLAKLFEEKI